MIYLLTVLLTVNIFLSHGTKLKQAYYWLYKKIFKPKFKSGEIVVIDDQLYEIITLIEGYPWFHEKPPYTYYCLPFLKINVIVQTETVFHESKIKKLTGILKELE